LTGPRRLCYRHIVLTRHSRLQPSSHRLAYWWWYGCAEGANR
jgi:hypothetical protein